MRVCTMQDACMHDACAYGATNQASLYKLAMKQAGKQV